MIGTGIMGTQIAIQAACYGYEVKTYDLDSKIFQNTVRKLHDLTTTGKGPTRPAEEWLKAAEKVKQCSKMSDALKDADLVIEACPEKLELKRRVLAQIDSLSPKEAILATNSSSIPISKIESATGRAEKCLNIHFYWPVDGTNFVEVMGGTKTTVETIETAQEWVKSIGCIPIVTKKEIVGFGFNRVWRAVKRECLFLWAGGYVDFRDLDRAWMITYRTDRGPFALMDEIGLDVVYDIEMVYYNESKDTKDYPPQALKDMIDRKELGVKTGKGFYAYPNPEYHKISFLGASPSAAS